MRQLHYVLDSVSRQFAIGLRARGLLFKTTVYFIIPQIRGQILDSARSQFFRYNKAYENTGR